ncbi:MAG: NUDIX domain-containing protein, partial [Flavobacteriales bacterium]|nr:NUDIX domain-containing protein [Flavobacteriales bacterium]
MSFSTENDVQEIYDLAENSSVKAIHIYDSELDGFKTFQSQHKIVEAAGGIVISPSGKILLIERLGKWDLPKGKMEKGEGKKEAAIREVQEECGVTELSILETLPTSFHTYEQKGKRILKPTYWYLMKSSLEEELIAQAEEGITAAEWLTFEEANQN